MSDSLFQEELSLNTEPEVFSVTDVVNLLAHKVDAIPTITVTGEVVGFRGPNARSGHCYFDIKDKNSKLSVVVWAGIYQSLGFALEDGMQINITGHFNVYKKNGSISFVAKSVELAGEGLLLKQIEELKRKLAAEGLFDEANKKQIKVFCERVICVTSLSGEVKDDVLQNINPLVDISFVGCKVEGAGAEEAIIAGLERADAMHPDAILLVRGGGSLESLMPFNSEAVCRAIAACESPVISGVGHEPDVTLTDFVADRRCSTPTKAATSVAPELSTVVTTINERQARLVKSFSKLLETSETALTHQSDLLHRAIQGQLAAESLKIDAYASRPCLLSPTYMVDERRENLMLDEQRFLDSWPRYLKTHITKTQHLSERLDATGQRLIKPYSDELNRLDATLKALSPLNVLGRGYAIACDESGHIVRNASDLKANQNVEVRLDKGSFEAQVRSTTTE